MCMRCQTSIHKDLAKPYVEESSIVFCARCIETMKNSNLIGYAYKGETYCINCVGDAKYDSLPIFVQDRKDWDNPTCEFCKLRLRVIITDIGHCPYCKSDNVDYGKIVFLEADQVYYPMLCKQCNRLSREYYSLEYTQTEGSGVNG